MDIENIKKQLQEAFDKAKTEREQMIAKEFGGKDDNICRAELQWMIDELCKYLKKNRNHLALELYRQLDRDAYLGRFGHIYAHNDEYDVDIKITRRKK